MVYSTRRFVLCLTLCHFVLVFFSPFSIAITSLGEERANLNAFRTVWEGLRFVIVALLGLFSYPFYSTVRSKAMVVALCFLTRRFVLCRTFS